MNPGLINIIILQNKQIRMGTLKLSRSNFSVRKEFIVTHKWVKMIHYCYEVHLYEKQAILRTKLYQKHSTLRNEKSTQPGLAMLRINTIITQPNVWTRPHKGTTVCYQCLITMMIWENNSVIATAENTNTWHWDPSYITYFKLDTGTWLNRNLYNKFSHRESFIWEYWFQWFYGSSEWCFVCENSSMKFVYKLKGMQLLSRVSFTKCHQKLTREHNREQILYVIFMQRQHKGYICTLFKLLLILNRKSFNICRAQFG